MTDNPYPRPLLLHLDELQGRLGSRRLALLVDVDGTISPIAPNPRSARVLPACRRALKKLAVRLPLVAVVSGRRASEAVAMVNVQGIVYVGNHGLERWHQGPHDRRGYSRALERAVGIALERIQPMVGTTGVICEEKGLTASIHYRDATDWQRARAEILRAASVAVQGLPVRVREGKRVVELRPDVMGDKGVAVKNLLKEHETEGALYLGDDLTDIDAFRAVHTWATKRQRVGIAVAVAGAETSRQVLDWADYVLGDSGEVARFLEWLVEAYPLSSGRRAR